MMSDFYKLYPVDAGGHIIGPPQELFANDDADAVAQADALSGGRPAELWSGARRVASFNLELPTWADGRASLRVPVRPLQRPRLSIVCRSPERRLD